MWKDPIITETRDLREQYAKQFGHEADAIFQDILHRQASAGKNLVTFAPRKPASTSMADTPQVLAAAAMARSC
jgi:hypothetical protein